jgi:DNA-binding transcriptional MocR family regulator
MTNEARWLARTRTSADAMPSRAMAVPTSDTIFFGGGLPDPRRHPTESLSTFLGELLSTRDAASLSYSYGRGDPELRHEIARRATERGSVEVTPSQVVVTNGSSGALALTALALIEAGDVVLCEELTYPAAISTFRQMGARVVPIAIDGDGMCTDQLDATMARLARDGARLKLVYTIATCHSPTGTTLHDARRRELVDLAERYDVVLVQDATYADIWFADHRAPELFELAPHRTIHVGSFSKTVAPGIRLGWATAPSTVADVMQQVRTDLGTSPLLQRAVARFVASGEFESHVIDGNAHYRRKRDVLLDELNASCRDAAEWDAPDGGFFVWLRLREASVRAVEAEAARHDVGFLSAPYFSAGDCTTQGIRLAYGELSAEQIVEGVARLRQVFEASAEAVSGGRRSG